MASQSGRSRCVLAALLPVAEFAGGEAIDPDKDVSGPGPAFLASPARPTRAPRMAEERQPSLRRMRHGALNATLPLHPACIRGNSGLTRAMSARSAIASGFTTPSVNDHWSQHARRAGRLHQARQERLQRSDRACLSQLPALGSPTCRASRPVRRLDAPNARRAAAPSPDHQIDHASRCGLGPNAFRASAISLIVLANNLPSLALIHRSQTRSGLNPALARISLSIAVRRRAL